MGHQVWTLLCVRNETDQVLPLKEPRFLEEEQTLEQFRCRAASPMTKVRADCFGATGDGQLML